jgi:murein tripeptide amidase MpaA
MQISSNFDGGNIVVSEIRKNEADLAIRPDLHTDFRQWFYFRCVAEPDVEREFRIADAGTCKVPEGWSDYQAVASSDLLSWSRIPTRFDGETLTFRHRAKYPITYYATFAPYSLERHRSLVVTCQQRPDVGIECLGQTLEGRPIDVVRIGELQKGRPVYWVTARQHPGEPMASWFTEGLLERLLDTEDPVAGSIRSSATIFVVPNMNPDGSFRGHIRVNAGGSDLNRAWQNPDRAESPEVALVRARMEETGVDFYLDVHGDEGLPYCFLVPSEGIPSVTATQVQLRKEFQEALLFASPDFQKEHGYPPDPPSQGDLGIGSNYVAEHFGCLSLTLEQPFKDAANNPSPAIGWSPGRSIRLGAATLTALAAVRAKLK